MLASQDNTFFNYKTFAILLIGFLMINDENKVFLLFDCCKSHNLWVHIETIIPESKKTNISFIGYQGSGHIWKINDKYCYNLGGVLNLVFQNALGIFQENHNHFKFEDIFQNEAQKFLTMHVFYPILYMPDNYLI